MFWLFKGVLYVLFQFLARVGAGCCVILILLEILFHGEMIPDVWEVVDANGVLHLTNQATGKNSQVVSESNPAEGIAFLTTRRLPVLPDAAATTTVAVISASPAYFVGCIESLWCRLSLGQSSGSCKVCIQFKSGFSQGRGRLDAVDARHDQTVWCACRSGIIRACQTDRP